MLKAHPWAKDYIGSGTGRRREVGSSSYRVEGAAAPCESSDDEGRVGLDDAMIDEAFHKLEEKRLEWAAEGDSYEHFYTHARGEKWTLTEKGKLYDIVMATARGGLPRYWAKRFQMGEVASFSL